MVLRLMRLLGADRLSPAEVDIGRSEVVDALMIADVIVVFDEGPYLAFEVAGQVVVVEQNAVFQGQVPALDFKYDGRQLFEAARGPPQPGARCEVRPRRSLPGTPQAGWRIGACRADRFVQAVDRHLRRRRRQLRRSHRPPASLKPAAIKPILSSRRGHTIPPHYLTPTPWTLCHFTLSSGINETNVSPWRQNISWRKSHGSWHREVPGVFRGT